VVFVPEASAGKRSEDRGAEGDEGVGFTKGSATLLARRVWERGRAPPQRILFNLLHEMMPLDAFYTLFWGY